MKPATYHVERSTTIAATPEKISPLLNDFHNWDQWSPWAKLDPNMRVTYSGAPAGQGAIYQWEGNSKVGKGRMEILAVEPTLTSIKLDFLSPFESHNQTNFVLLPQGSATPRDLDDGRTEHLREQAHECVRIDGQDDGQGLRHWPGPAQVRCREAELTRSAEVAAGFCGQREVED